MDDAWKSYCIREFQLCLQQFLLPFVIMKDLITDVVLLSEGEILEGVRLALQTTHNLAETAGAAAIAAALKAKDRLAGKKVALIMSGGNLDHEHLLQALH